jgi:tyrosinase
MRFSSLLVLAVSALSSVSAAPRPQEEDTGSEERAAACKKPLVRQEWRDLTTEQQDSYIDAVVCLRSKPPKTSYPGSKNRFDDFQGLHIVQTGLVHFTGRFLPWHRGLVYLWEKELRDTCNYNGAMPYWNWTLDALDWTSSPLFDPVHGFGGNGPFLADLSGFPPEAFHRLTFTGRTGGGCVTDGPFANFTVNMGPGNSTAYNPRCLHRDFIPTVAADAGGIVKHNYLLEAPDYFQFLRRIDGECIGVDCLYPHHSAHIAVGGQAGEMTNTFSSPGDPLFYLHHAFLDKLWDTWQRKNFAVRKSDMGGPDTMWAYPFNFMGDKPYTNITLDTTISYGVWGTYKIRDVMDTASKKLCYKYV